MGLIQSTPERAQQLPPDELVASREQATPPVPTRPTSPPHPSRSSLNPTSSRRSAFSYFLPLTHPDIQHSHLNPTLEDVRKTADMLSTCLPAELVVRVLDEAGYWAGCRSLIQKELTVMARSASPRILHSPRNWSNGQEREVGLADGREGEVWYLASEPIGCDETRSMRSQPTRPTEDPNDKADHSGSPSSLPHNTKDDYSYSKEQQDRYEDDGEKQDKCWLRGVVIETLSKDQGWSDNRAAYGTYEHSYSWFEVSLLRDGKEVENTRRSFQNNIHAGQYFKAHRTVLGSQDELIRQAKLGDRVIIWARAQYPGWQNIVREAAITLYTAPFPPQL